MPIEPATLTSRWYVPRSERDEDGKPVEGATRFHLKSLDVTAHQEVFGDTIVDEVTGSASFSGRAIRAAIRHGLIGWENFGSVKFTGANWPAVYEMLSVKQQDAEGKPREDLLTEIFMEIIEISNVGDEGKKG